jgi:hypothetical protein
VLLLQVCDTYQDVPYHNCIHGGDVLQSLHCVLMKSNVLREATPPTMMFACLMAALVHDVGHVGRTNHFLVSTYKQCGAMSMAGKIFF